MNLPSKYEHPDMQAMKQCIEQYHLPRQLLAEPTLLTHSHSYGLMANQMMQMLTSTEPYIQQVYGVCQRVQIQTSQNNVTSRVARAGPFCEQNLPQAPDV